jgi:hypothetical protein
VVKKEGRDGGEIRKYLVCLVSLLPIFLRYSYPHRQGGGGGQRWTRRLIPNNGIKKGKKRGGKEGRGK